MGLKIFCSQDIELSLAAPRVLHIEKTVSKIFTCVSNSLDTAMSLNFQQSIKRKTTGYSRKTCSWGEDCYFSMIYPETFPIFTPWTWVVPMDNHQLNPLDTKIYQIFFWNRQAQISRGSKKAASTLFWGKFEQLPR